MTATPSGADVLANTLLDSLTAGVNFSVPTIDLSNVIFNQPPTTGPLYEAVEPIEFSALTDGTVGGTGTFDKLMSSLVAHLKVEYQANRISGAEYTKAYVGIIQAALQTAAQFLLAKDQAYWGALLAQAQARTAETEIVKARIELETARVLLARNQFEAATAEVNYGLVKIKIATEDVAYSHAVKQGENIEEQTANLVKTGTGIDYTNSFILPEQKKLLQEQVEVQRGQTSDVKTDNSTPVVGLIGKQKDLYTQQIISFQRDAETKAAKIWADAYITQLTLADGEVGTPAEFSNLNVSEVMEKLKSNLNLIVP